jgi:hypothetical protein
LQHPIPDTLCIALASLRDLANLVGDNGGQRISTISQMQNRSTPSKAVDMALMSSGSKT